MLSTIYRPLQLNGCQPRTLASLMDIYEGSYWRLMRLAPELKELGDHNVSRVAGGLDLHLSVVERFKYTEEIVLTYRFETREGALLEPNLLVRVYHDARAAEARNGRLRHSHRTRHCRRRVPSELERRWELNRFLNRWLGYCQHQGHRFLKGGILEEGRRQPVSLPVQP